MNKKRKRKKSKKTKKERTRKNCLQGQLKYYAGDLCLAILTPESCIKTHIVYRLKSVGALEMKFTKLD